MALFAGEATKVVLGFLSALITARSLGPEGKGTLSTILFIGVLLSYGATMGLGDATTVLVGRGRYSLQQATSASILPIGAACILGIGCLWSVVPVAGWNRILPTIVLASALLPVTTYARMLTALINTRERIGLTTLASTTSAFLTAIFLLVLVLELDLQLFGAMLASLIGGVGGLLILGWCLRGLGLSARPARVAGFLGEALRFGLFVEVAYLLVAMSQRLDLLIVYALLGEAPAGRYSVALALSQLAAYGPFALMSASFPRLAQLGGDRFLQLVLQLFRVSLTVGLATGLVLMAILPLLVKPLFGPGFAAAVSPTLLLVPAALLGSQQWLLARAAVAIGRNQPYLISFSSSVALLVALDYLLVPRFGLAGAAVAATASACVGLSICLIWFRRSFHLPLKELFPRAADVTMLRSVLNDLRASAGRGG